MNKKNILNWFKNAEHSGFEYNDLLLSNNMEIWQQNTDDDIVVELHIKNDTDKEFGAYFIGLYGSTEELTDKVYKYQNDFTDLGFDRFVEKYKNKIIDFD